MFIPSWISCLDEYIFIWINRFACSGFVFLPLNGHTKGNKYHTICCDKSGILYDLGVVEGRDHLIPMGIPKFNKSPNMKTVGIFV